MAATLETRPRLTSVDAVRGVVMLLMALDHVRVYAGIPAGGPTAGVFLTRWVTHFCAPAFFFLAGTSAFLRGAGRPGEPGPSRWLATRGLALVLLELTLLRFCWTFNFDYAHYSLAGVIWSLGWGMVVLAALVRLPVGAIAAFGLVLVLGHDTLPALVGERRGELLAGAFGPLLRVLYFGGGISVAGSADPEFFVLYSIVPWAGVMAAGYAFGHLITCDPAQRASRCLRIGLAATGAFLLLRATQAYGDRPWVPAEGEPGWAPLWIMFLATTKYPASLQFLLMTLGPTLMALGALEGARGRLAGWLAVFGRVPLFYYLLHIPLIHLVAIAIAMVRSPAALPWLFANHPLLPPEVPEGYRWSLPMLYGVTLGVALLLYLPCRWYARAKSERRWGWVGWV
jgi:uncharacterized membrane protein